MISTGYCRMMSKYNAWMNDRLFDICAGLSDTERKANRHLFFKSIHGTLNHLLYGDIAWMSRFLGQPQGLPPLGQDLYNNFDDLKTARSEWNKKIIHWAEILSEEWLAEQYTYTSVVDGRDRTLQNWILVTHMFNHGTHHRGQLTAALSQMGLDYGSTDLPFMPPG